MPASVRHRAGPLQGEGLSAWRHAMRTIARQPGRPASVGATYGTFLVGTLFQANQRIR
jgi:hypothetical protein